MNLNALTMLMMKKENNKPIDVFEFLSANEMEILLYQPFMEQSLVRFRKEIKPETLEKIPFFLLVEEFLKYLSEHEPVKLTNIGNLPRVVINYLYGLRIIEEEEIESNLIKLLKEDDSLTIKNTKIISEFAGLTTNRKSKLSISKKGKDLLKNRAELFKEVFFTYCLLLNWSYHDRYGDNQIGQLGIGFVIGLLIKYSKEEKDSKFYSDKYLKAFPGLMNGLCDKGVYLKEDQFINCFTVRTFERFLNWFGMVECRKDNLDYYGKIIVKKTDILDSIFYATKF